MCKARDFGMVFISLAGGNLFETLCKVLTGGNLFVVRSCLKWGHSIVVVVVFFSLHIFNRSK